MCIRDRYDLRHRQHEVVVAFEELATLVEHARLSCHGSSDVATRELLGARDFELDRVFHPLRILSNERGILRVVLREAQRGKCLVYTCEVRLCLFDRAAEIGKHLLRTLDDPPDVVFERDTAKPLPPGDTCALE